MILTRPWPLERVLSALGGAKDALVVGCNGCAAVHRTGGKREAEELARRLSAAGVDAHADSLARQCDVALARGALSGHREAVVLSLACGAGVQALAEALPERTVLPAADTALVGYRDGSAVLEGCRACGSCLLERTAGLCPLARCPKGLSQGPCGGQAKGMCEVGRGARPCVWVAIWRRLAARGRDRELLGRLAPPLDRRAGLGPRQGEEGR